MKKSLFFLLFLIQGVLVSAMNEPVRTFDLLPSEKEQIPATPEQACMMCANCGDVIVCVQASNCSKADHQLTALLASMHCNTSDN